MTGTAALFALFGYINLRVVRQQSEDLVLQAAERVTDLILRSAHFGMLHHDRETLYNTIQDMGADPGIRRLRIFNKEGRTQSPPRPAKWERWWTKARRPVTAAIAQSKPLTKLNRPDRARMFFDRQGDRILGVIRPIENSPACSEAACHVHPASQRVLGVVDANLSLTTVDAQVARQQGTLIWFLCGAIVIGSLTSVAFIWLAVHRPLLEEPPSAHTGGLLTMATLHATVEAALRVAFSGRLPSQNPAASNGGVHYRLPSHNTVFR